MNVKPEFLYLIAWLQAAAATLGSLYFSEVMGFPPCELCWYQRIFMYPLVWILGAAIVKKEFGTYYYGLGLSLAGLVVAFYQSYLTYFGSQTAGGSGVCSLETPCTNRYIDWFGFISIPLLSLVAFGVISLCLAGVGLAAARQVKENKKS